MPPDKEFFQEVDILLFQLLEKTEYYLSPYYQDQTKQFIEVGEEGLAFMNLIHPYYEECHAMAPEVRQLINTLAKMMEITLPEPKKL
jgi:hypothetical protein